MKNLCKFVIGLLALTATARAAEGPPCQIEVQVIRLSANSKIRAGAGLRDAEEWKQALASGDAQLLEGSAQTGQLVDSNLVFIGDKVPIYYADPRVNGYQVQYIDGGFTVDCRPTEVAGGMLKVDCKVQEWAVVDGIPHPNQEGYRLQTSFLVRPGQVAIVGSTLGRFTAPALKAAYPKVTFGENDRIMFAISVRKL